MAQVVVVDDLAGRGVAAASRDECVVDVECVELMTTVTTGHPDLGNEDIGE